MLAQFREQGLPCRFNTCMCMCVRAPEVKTEQHFPAHLRLHENYLQKISNRRGLRNALRRAPHWDCRTKSKDVDSSDAPVERHSAVDPSFVRRPTQTRILAALVPPYAPYLSNILETSAWRSGLGVRTMFRCGSRWMHGFVARTVNRRNCVFVSVSLIIPFAVKVVCTTVAIARLRGKVVLEEAFSLVEVVPSRRSRE